MRRKSLCVNDIAWDAPVHNGCGDGLSPFRCNVPGGCSARLLPVRRVTEFDPDRCSFRTPGPSS